jgi:hypothetical protein
MLRSLVLGFAAIAAVATTSLSPANASSDSSTYLANNSHYVLFKRGPVVIHCHPSKYVFNCM